MGEARHRKENGGEVRISGGVFRGQKIKTPGGGTHPMGERERIALFNMIFDKIANGRVADLYCGGGTLGIEALSRGADFALFVDKDARATSASGSQRKEGGCYGPFYVCRHGMQTPKARNNIGRPSSLRATLSR